MEFGCLPCEWKSFGNGRAFLNPLAHFRGEFRVAEGWFRAAFGGIPARQHKRILGDVMDDFLERLAAVLFWVFQLAGEFSGTLALKDHSHVRGREMPLRMPWRHALTGKILVLVTVLALERVKAFAVRTALHVLEMRVAVFSLQRNIAGRMAIHAARMHENGISGEEGGA